MNGSIDLRYPGLDKVPTGFITRLREFACYADLIM